MIRALVWWGIDTGQTLVDAAQTVLDLCKIIAAD